MASVKRKSSRRLRLTVLCVLASLAGAPALACDCPYLGLLRARDLTPFGFLRLDMRPAHAISGEVGTWGVEAELAYQNTWALSKGAEQYLERLPGRRDLGPADAQAIRDLPGENYLVDLELASLDLTFHRKFTPSWGAYLVLSGVSYSGGFLDHTIEKFHDLVGFDENGRPSAARNDVNIFADLQSTQFALFEAPVSMGLLDPTVGIRYSRPEPFRDWNIVLEAAAKVAFRGRDEFLSTGESDFGVQATFQRFSDHHAWYVSASAVYYDGSNSIMPTGPQVVPTLVLGYERALSARTHAILQAHLSDSVYSRRETGVDDLLDPKYQLSLGFYRRMGRGVVSFAITENIRNFNNTPDIGLQLGWAYSPALAQDGG